MNKYFSRPVSAPIPKSDHPISLEPTGVLGTINRSYSILPDLTVKERWELWERISSLLDRIDEDPTAPDWTDQQIQALLGSLGRFRNQGFCRPLPDFVSRQWMRPSRPIPEDV